MNPADLQLTIVAGDGQIANAGSILPEPLTVRVTGRGGVPVPGLRVYWRGSERGAVVPSSAFTDADGYSSSQRRLGAGTGIRTTTAHLAVAPAHEVRFSTIAHIAGGFRMMLHPDDSAEDRADSVMARLQPFRVMIFDYFDAPAPNVPVAWWGGPDRGVVIVNTDADGVAAFTLEEPTLAGERLIVGAVTGMIGSPVDIRVTLKPGNPTHLVAASGQTPVASIRADLPRVVEVRDAYGNAVADVPIEWRVTAGDGSVEPDAPVTRPEYPGEPPQARAMHRLGKQLQQEVTARAPTLPGQPELTFSTLAPAATVLLHPGWDDDWCYYYGWCDGEDGPHFLPDTVTVPVGAGVMWAWLNVLCDLRFEDDPGGDYTAESRRHGTHVRAFTAPGTYRFRCSHHSTSYTEGPMIGAVVVEPE